MVYTTHSLSVNDVLNYTQTILIFSTFNFMCFLYISPLTFFSCLALDCRCLGLTSTVLLPEQDLKESSSSRGVQTPPPSTASAAVPAAAMAQTAEQREPGKQTPLLLKQNLIFIKGVIFI